MYYKQSEFLCSFSCTRMVNRTLNVFRPLYSVHMRDMICASYKHYGVGELHKQQSCDKVASSVHASQAQENGDHEFAYQIYIPDSL